MRTLGLPAAVTTLALAVLTAPASAQPVGDEFQVNTYTTGAQTTAFNFGGHLVAADASGNFVVVWYGNGQGAGGYGVFGQRYDSDGSPRGAEFRVNSYTTGFQRNPSVASAASGDFVVVWDGRGPGDADGVFGRRYDSAGLPVGTEFRVNTVTAQDQSQASVASAANGGFVVVWRSYQNQAGHGEIYGRRYDGAGDPLGGEFRVNSYGTGFQYTPSVASDPSGNFVVVWASFPYNYTYGRFGVFGQRYDSAGVPRGGEFRVDTNSRSGPPSAASDASGDFVVVWQDQGAYGGREIYGRRFDSQGTPLGGPFHVNTYTTGYQESASVAADADGNFLVVWHSEQDGSSLGVFGRRFDGAGSPLTDEFQINSYTTDLQMYPSVGATGTNQFVVVWTSDEQDGDDDGVFGQRFDFGAGTITVVSPNGTDVWRIGATERIRWTHDLGPNATFRIELDRDDDGTYDELITAEAPVDSATRGYFNWIVTGPRTGTARVRVSWTDEPGVADESDATFQIRPAPISAREGLREP